MLLHDRARDADGVALLECVEADRLGRHLAGNHHHRDRVHVGGGDPGNGVGDARAGSDERDPDLARGARVAVCRVHGALLVANEHVLHLVLLEELVVDEQDRAAGIAEDNLDAFFLQAANDDLGARKLAGLDSVHDVKSP
jgi:hypothetical protein